MSTMEILSTGYRAARAAARQRRTMRSGVRTRTHRISAAIAEHGLAVTAMACFITAATMVAIPLGLVVAGVALLVLELRAGS
jgi:hypothetical protein